MTRSSLDYGLDLRLMHILSVLFEECSVSRTAVVLGYSQPSVSQALKKLRDILGDPLLVRSGVRLIPTERGLEIHTCVKRILSEIRDITNEAHPFDPATYESRMRVHAANCLGTFFMPRIAALARAEAPNMPLDFCAVHDDNLLFRELETGALDVIIGNWPKPRDYLRFAPLLETRTVLVLHKNHPLAHRDQLSLEEYLALDHLSPSPHTKLSISPIDGQLAQLDKKRKIAMTVAEFTLVPHMLEHSELVFSSSHPFAKKMASQGDFVIVKAPPELGSMRFYTLWHERSHLSPANQWFRKLLRRVAREIDEFEHSAARIFYPEPIGLTE